MNFLAHLYLADDTAYSRIGNMLGDFVAAGGEQRYNEEIRRGIELHRKVDRFTDSHPVFLRSKQRISDAYRLLKGIMIDIFYDHFLARNWREYSEVPLEEFCEEVYEAFLAHQHILPPRLQQMLPIMIRGNWLVSYRNIEGIAWVLRGMSRRLSRSNNLAAGIAELQNHYPAFEGDFQDFFPELMAFVEEMKRS